MWGMQSRLAKILTTIIIGVAVLPMVSFAQTSSSINISQALNNELGVDIVPDFPKPNETVSVDLTLFTGDLNSADITWYQNGKIALSGKGETRYSFQTGSSGTETKIEIRIKLLNGASFSKTITISPAGVDLVWEADSYVPPFYKGKALHPMQGILKIVALPEFVSKGARASPSNLIYKWSNDVATYQSQSGYGKNVLILKGSLLGKSENVKVLVTNPANNMSARGSINIDPIDPEIVFYQNDSYYGYIFDSAVSGAFKLSGDEVQVLAAPYYFTKEKAGGLTYEWRLNNQAVPELAGSRTAIFKKPEGGVGSSAVNLQVTNVRKILQQAENSLTINFENK